MQQLDDLGIWKVPQEPPSEEPLRDVDEATPSPDSPEKVDGPAVLSPGRSRATSTPESAPASPQRPLSADAEEKLLNGEMPDGHLFGNEEAGAEEEATPVAVEEGDHQPPPSGGPEAASPAGQSLDPDKAPASHQRKLAMEEMVIRDHLGQEVGCMDAVGQKQRSLEKEEESEDPTSLEGRPDSWSQPGPAEGISDLLADGPLEPELSSRDGPEGESPTSQHHQSPLGTLPKEDSHPKGQVDGPLGAGSPGKEAGGRGGEQKAVPGRSAREREPPPALAPGDEPATVSVQQDHGNPVKTPEGQGSGPSVESEGPGTPGPPLEQPSASLPQRLPPGQEMEDLSSPEEVRLPLLDPAGPSSAAQIRSIPQDTALSLQGTKESLLDQTPSQEDEGSLLGAELLFSSLPLEQNPSLPESKGSLLEQTPPAMQGDPPSLPDPLPPPSSVQGKGPLPPDATHSVMDQVTSSLREADRALQSWRQTQTASLLDQPFSPLPEEEPLALQPAMPQGQDPLGHEEEGSFPYAAPPPADQLPPSPGPTLSLLDTQASASAESPVTLQGQRPVPPEPHVSPLPEADVCLPSQIPPSVDGPGESPGALREQIPPNLQGTESSSPATENPTSSLPEASDIQSSLPNHTSPNPPKEEGAPPDLVPATSEDRTPTLLQEQPPPSQVAAKSLPEGQTPSDDVAGHASSPGKAPSPASQEAPPVGQDTLPSSSQETLQPLLDQSKTGGNLEAQGSSNASVASAGVGEATGVLENLCAEKQPLLEEATGGPGDVPAGGLPPKGGILKQPQGATGSPAPKDSGTRSSANTACARQLQAAVPRQGQDPEPEKGKRKSCQCCTLM